METLQNITDDIRANAEAQYEAWQNDPNDAPDGCYWSDYLRKLADRIEASLLAPPRNCDLYATLQDARNAFFSTYVPDETESSATAFAIWLLDPAKEANK